MKHKTIGIIGGAGPLAGTFFVEKLIRLCTSLFGCHKNADFPKIHLISFPFSEMLSSTIDETALRQELKGCIQQLRMNGAEVLSIACNTLHIFLDPDDTQEDLVHLPKELGAFCSNDEPPLVLCTSTSAKAQLHKHFFPCKYLNPIAQERIDLIIDQVLRNGKQPEILNDLLTLIDDQTESTMILGCTELSLFYSETLDSSKKIIDPLEVGARKILERSMRSANFLEKALSSIL